MKLSPLKYLNLNKQGMTSLKIYSLLLIVLFSTLFQSCISSQAGITTSNIPLDGRRYDVLGPEMTTVTWVSIDFGFLGFPLEIPPIDEACNTLMEKKGGDALINIRYSTDRSIILFVSLHRFHIKADVIKLK